MAKSLNILPNPALKPEVTDCGLLEGNLEEWIVCCSQRFFPLARKIARDDSLAEDALQISWIKILQSINHAYFDGPKACPWVSRIVANTAKNVRHQRHRRREVPIFEIQAPSRTPEDLAQEKQLLTLLREMIALLPDTYRQVIELRVYEGFSTRQTANLLHKGRGSHTWFVGWRNSRNAHLSPILLRFQNAWDLRGVARVQDITAGSHAAQCWEEAVVVGRFDSDILAAMAIDNGGVTATLKPAVELQPRAEYCSVGVEINASSA